MFPVYILIGEEIHPLQKKKLFSIHYQLASMEWPSITAFNALESLCPNKKVPDKFTLNNLMFAEWMEKVKELTGMRNIRSAYDVFQINRKSDLYAIFSAIVGDMSSDEIIQLFKMIQHPKIGRISQLPFCSDNARMLDLMTAHRCADKVVLITNEKCKVPNKFGTEILNLKEKTVDDVISFLYDINVAAKPPKQDS